MKVPQLFFGDFFFEFHGDEVFTLVQYVVTYHVVAYHR